MDHRKHERIQVQYPASVSDERVNARGDIADLSVAGCRVRGPCLISKDEGVTVLIHVPRYEAPLSVQKAVVRWSDELNLGIEFVEIEPSNQRRLRELIQAIKAALSENKGQR